MSTELNEIKSDTNDTVYVSQHAGGRERGILFQVAQKGADESWKYDSVNMTVEQARALKADLDAWLEDKS